MVSDFEGVWEAFCAAGTTLGHTPGEREAWHRGRGRYALWLLRLDPGPVAERVRVMQERLGGLVRPGRTQDLHVTVFVCGFPAPVVHHDDDVAEHRLAQAHQDLQAVLPRAPELIVGGVNGFRSCAVLEVADPLGDLARVRTRLAQWSDEVRFEPFRPHVTLGTFPETVSVAPLIQALGALRHQPPLTWRPQALELVEFDARAEQPVLETRWRVHLVG